jgi:phytoene dehydrogenase-like protein
LNAEDARERHSEPRTPLRASYDVAVVGGGHNGLVAAAYLTLAGRSCVVLERRARLGGAVLSERPFAGVDAHISRYAYLISLLPQVIVQELGLSLRLKRRRIASYTPDPRVAGRRGLLVHAEDPAATQASFRALTGSESTHGAWQRHQSRMRRIAAAVFPTLTEPLRSRDEMRRLVGDDAAWEAVFERPLAEIVLPGLSDDLAAGVLQTDSLIGTFASAADAGLRQNRCLLYHSIGRCTGEWLVPVGGMGALTEGLAHAARAAGAALCTGTEVLSLRPDDEGAEVHFSDGAQERVLRARHVLVGAAPAELERLLGAEDPSAPRPEGSQLKLNLVLSRLPALRDSATAPEQAFAGTFHVNQSTEQLERSYAEAAAGAIPALPPCEAYCHSLTDPSILGHDLRAAGAHTLTVFVLHMPARIFAGDPQGARAAALRATLGSLDSLLAEPLADCLLRARDVEPCLEVMSPLDVEHELRMPGGHIFHRDLSWPFAEREQELGAWGVETSHRSILLCGAGARRGGAVSGVPGRNAAMAILASG